MSASNAHKDTKQGKGLALVVKSERVEASLWRRSKQDHGDEARARLFEHYRPLATRMARVETAKRKYLGYEFAEVQQLAFEGLLQAIKRYDAAMGVPFGAFARRRIHGNIVDGLAASSESSAQYRYRKRVERHRLRSLEQDKSADGNALEELGKLASMLAIGLFLEDDTPVDPDQLPSGEVGAYETLAWAEMQATLKSLTRNLGPREKFVIEQHYQYDVSFSQIAEVLGLTKGRISQIHKAALLRLREELQKFT